MCTLELNSFIRFSAHTMHTTHTHTQIDDLAVLYYRREDNDVKYLDLDATIDELMSDFNLVCDK